jgi:hypothetical protein
MRNATTAARPVATLHLKERGLKGIRLITSDACLGLAESAAEFFPDAACQRCIVHWYRNIFSHVPLTKGREVGSMLKGDPSERGHRGDAREGFASGREAARVTPDQGRRACERLPTTLSPRSIGGEFARTTRSSASGARSGDGPASSVHSQMDKSGRRQTAPHRRRHVVEQKIPEHRTAEGSADARCRHRVSQGRALSQTWRSIEACA